MHSIKINSMIQEILNGIQDKIQEQIQEKFGLNADQTSQSTSILLENFKKFFSEDLMSADGFDKIKMLFENGFQNLAENPVLQNLQSNIQNDLKTKVGLNDDLANKVKDFQLKELFDSIQNEFLGEDGKPDIAKVLQKFGMESLQAKAQEILGGKFDLGSLFGKK